MVMSAVAWIQITAEASAANRIVLRFMLFLRSSLAIPLPFRCRARRPHEHVQQADLTAKGETASTDRERRSTGGEDSWCEQRLSQEGRRQTRVIRRWKIVRYALRLDEADRGCAEAIGRDREAVADLERPAVVIPRGDAGEGQLLHQGSGPAQPQAEQGI